jgi:hypothetical protein
MFWKDKLREPAIQADRELWEYKETWLVQIQWSGKMDVHFSTELFFVS